MLLFPVMKNLEIVKNNNPPDYIYFCLKNRLLLINYNILFIIICNNVIKYIEDWNLLLNNKVPDKKKYYINYIKNYIKEEIILINNLEKKLNTNKKIIIYNNIDNKQYNLFYFENIIKFDSHVKSVLKTIFPNYIKTNLNFYKSKFCYKQVKVIEMTGEEEEILKTFRF